MSKFFDVLTLVVVFIVPIILYLMEKAGVSLAWIFIVGWLSIAGAAIYLVLNFPWVWAAPRVPVTIWRVCFVCASALLLVGYCALHIWAKPENVKEVQHSSTAPQGSSIQASQSVQGGSHRKGAFISGLTLVDERDHSLAFVADIKLQSGEIVSQGEEFGKRWVRLFTVVTDFEKAHNGALPTAGLVNKRLKADKQDFRIVSIRRKREEEWAPAINADRSHNFRADNITSEGFNKVFSAQDSENAQIKDFHIKRRQTPPSVQIIGSIVNKDSNNYGTQVVNNTPPSRLIPSDKETEFSDRLRESPEKGCIGIVKAGTTDDVAPLEQQVTRLATDAGWSYERGDVSTGRGSPQIDGLECYFSGDWNSQAGRAFRSAMKSVPAQCKYVDGSYKFDQITIHEGCFTLVIGRNVMPQQ